MMNLGPERRAQLRQEIATGQAITQRQIEKQDENLLQPRPLTSPLAPHHKEGSLILDNNQVGYLKGVTRYGATFHPLDLDKAQHEKAELYIAMRDSYQRLYAFEAETREENKEERANLNTSYDSFVERFGYLMPRRM